MRRKSANVVVAAAGALVLAAGCGTSTPAHTGAPGITVPTAPAPTGSVIKIGVIGSQTGAQASSDSQFATVAPAWADYVNRQLGGIDGHPVQVVSADDAGDPAKAQVAARDLLAQHVVAIVVGSDDVVASYDGSVIGAGVPLVSGAANVSDWYTKPGMYASPTDTVSGLANQVLVAKQVGKATKFATLYCAELALCGQVVPMLRAAASSAGMGFTSLAVSSTATSYTAQCLSLQQQQVDYVQLDFATAAAARFAENCEQQGYNPSWGTSSQAVGPSLESIPNFTAYGPAYVFSTADGTGAATTFTDSMKLYAQGDNWHDGDAAFTWAGLELLRTAMAHVGTAAVTPQAVTTDLQSLSATTLGGLLPNPVSFPGGKPVGFGTHPCSFVFEVKNGKESVLSDPDTVCAKS
jgi:branched-chain amino acid transport system substrate-binding protein